MPPAPEARRASLPLLRQQRARLHEHAPLAAAPPNEKAAAAVFKLGLQILYENHAIVTACAPNFYAEPASLL